MSLSEVKKELKDVQYWIDETLRQHDKLKWELRWLNMLLSSPVLRFTFPGFMSFYGGIEKLDQRACEIEEFLRTDYVTLITYWKREEHLLKQIGEYQLRFEKGGFILPRGESYVQGELFKTT